MFCKEGSEIKFLSFSDCRSNRKRKKENNENVLYVFRDREYAFTSKNIKPTETSIGNFLKVKIGWKRQVLIFKILKKENVVWCSFNQIVWVYFQQKSVTRKKGLLGS